MLRRTLALVGLLLMAGAAGAASSFPLGAGTILKNGSSEITMGQTYELTTIGFDSFGSPVLDGTKINLTGTGSWVLEEFSPTRFTLNGSLSSSGSFQVTGPAAEYTISGVGPLLVRVGGQTGTVYSLTAGSRVIVVDITPPTGEVIMAAFADTISILLALSFLAIMFTLIAASLMARRG